MRRFIGMWVLALFVGCDDAGEAAGSTDCRQATQACAPGFECAPVGAAWECVRAGAIDDDAGRVDAAVERDAEPDAALPDAALPDAGPMARPGGACGPDLPCVDGECRDDLPGGFCRVPCRDDAVCGDDAVCSAGGSCRTRCDDLGCRRGWVCDGRDDPAVCRPDCNEVACSDTDICNPDSGLCEPAPMCTPEICNDKDDDCDGTIDEGVVNACGGCGDVPEEVCNERDDDCDGEVDEGVLNACGACGEAPVEACNDLDDDCDGEVDEGVRNACGDCGPAPAEICDGLDADCDGVVDEGARCAAGQVCLEGRCRRPPSGPSGPCAADEDCEQGVCRVEAGLPGGWCQVDCARDADCGADAACLDVGVLACLERCDAGACRPGWVCYDDDDVCFPSCQNIGCADGFVCRADGFCAVPVVSITLTQVFIAPGLSDGTTWDGFGNVDPALFDAAAAAIVGGAVGAIAGLAAQFANAGYAPPDPYGSATLFAFGQAVGIDLPRIADTFTPDWPGVTWRVSLDPNEDIRIRVSLTDEDLVNDDPIGTVELNSFDLLDALDSGRAWAVRTVDQGVGSIVAVVISVRAE